MSTSYKNFQKGFGVIPKLTSESTLRGEFEVLATDGKLYYHDGATNSPMVTETQASQGTHRLKNKDLEANTVDFVDGTDTTKRFGVDISTATTGTATDLIFLQTANRQVRIPDADDTLVARNTTDTLTNKTIDGNNNTLINIPSGALPGNIATTNTVQTFTNKTIIAPVIATISNTGTLTLPTTTDTLVGRTTTDTLTNKTLVTPIINRINSDAGNNLVLNAPTGQTANIDINGVPIVTISATSATLAAAVALILTNNSKTVGLMASPTAAASYVITFPPDTPTANTALVFNGSNYVWSTAGGWVTGTATSLVNGGSIGISVTAGQQLFIVGGSGGAVTLSGTAFGISTPVDGAVVRIISNSSINTVALVNTDSALGTIVNGNPILYKYYAMDFQFSSSLSRWIEIGRNF